NIRQLIQRLSTNYRSYDDITVLVVRFLEILDLGLSLQSGQTQRSSDSRILQAVSKRTPFLGGTVYPVSALESQKGPANQAHFVELRFHELSSLRVAINTDPDVLHSEAGRHALHRILEQFHILWKAKLREDQEEEARKSELYRYRGSWEDEEEVDQNELNQLFPTYESDTAEDDGKATRIDPKAISVRLATLHAELFQSEDAKKALSDYVRQSAKLLGSIWSAGDSSKSHIRPSEHLSGALLLLEDAMNAGNRSPSGKYNFYTDSNFSEARRLVSLAHSVKSRFLQIQQAWPEHAVLQDVIICCKEVLQFKHTEPVAKFLTKVEKLHALVHEWQLVASKEYSAASLYNELTNLIISWRRLELSTWAKLLDLEKEKCAQDVSSWWFVAYEAVIAAPIQLAASGEAELSAHIQSVISTLEQFFMSTTVGQYSERLRLVANFRSLLALYVRDYPALEQLVFALGNFLEHFRPFEPAVHKSMEDRRAAIEKDIKQQIQLASWKDTNIIALKESARRSHFRLFKLVRKYREVLAQPVQPIIHQGMTNEPIEPNMVTDEVVLASASFPDALALCQEEPTIWPSRPPRFRNADSTAGNMTDLYSSMPNEFDISEDLDSFVKFFIESITEFKSQTPKVLTEDNKDDVQHLKVQKRRFYADTLKRLLEMGIKRNASTNLIESQSSIAQVLATTPSLKVGNSASHLIKGSDLYFHRFLDLLPRVRQSSREYSEDLSNVEISRSVGTVEHLMFLLRKQRGVISPALSHLEMMKSTIMKMSNLWTSGSASLCKSHSDVSKDRQDLRRAVAWLIPILGLAAEIVQLHAKFSEVDASKVSDGLHAWSSTFSRLKSSLDNIPELPSGLTSQRHNNILEEVSSSLASLVADVSKWTAERPDLSFALAQIIPWAEAKGNATVRADSQDSLAIQEFDARLLAAMDKILVSLQKLKDVPASLTSTGSLSRSDEFFTRAMKAVRLSDVTFSLESVLGTLQHLQADSHNTYVIASALVASLLPITNRYFYICRDIIQRFVSVHRETCKMTYILAKSFTQIASEGFCTPAEPSTEESKSGKLESGTGLGEGEGAEDISKDVGDDEDLSELAQQEQNEKPSEDMEASAEAVNMDHEEMQGEEVDREAKDEEEDEDASGSEGEDDVDEEVGSVNDLDDTAVDEKMWDGDHDEKQKETENEQGKGAAESDEQTAAQEERTQEKCDKDAEQEGEEEENEEDEEAPEDEGEAVGREDMEVTDPHAKEEETLDLPEEMQLDGEEKEDDGAESDDGMDDMSDFGPAPAEDEQQAEGNEDNAENPDMDDPTDEQEPDRVDEEAMEDQEANEAEGADEANAAEEEELEARQEEFLTQHDDNEAGGEEVAPSEAVNGGLGTDEDQNKEQGAAGNAQQEDGSTDPATNAEKPTGGAKEGEDSQRKRDAGGADDVSLEDPQLQAFKKLGDILDEWHRRRKEIMDASKQEDDDELRKQLPEDTDMAEADFEHLADQDDVADTQALGQASEEQAKALDQNKGVESDVKPGDNDMLPDAGEEPQDVAEENRLEDDMQIDGEGVPTEGQTVGALIPDRSRTQERTTDPTGQLEANEGLDEVDAHLAAIHLSSTLPPLTPREEAQRLWSHYENATNNLSLSLTEQLRLILAPTLATKLRGDFRTGKRLNIKRIIPYIASQYKRDKIWMRRSIPSKRNYQIMLAVDDSKSMLESGSGQLAFETLALVAKSLSMLEVGDLCVLGFGNEDHVRVAHEFGKPFSSEAGTQVFQHFSYQQTGTNVRKLIADSIALFREARWKQSPAGGNADLWQLELIISDGICEDHDTIRRLVRQAQEERIMIVFIIVDAVKGSSILDLTQASFEPDTESGTGEMKLKMKRYLEGFPFPYYLVVRDVRELPAVLATALKQWFAEVVDVSS
ncbi:hypothetical protein KXX62_000251, partial [Aspergillus fumigatus]